MERLWVTGLPPAASILVLAAGCLVGPPPAPVRAVPGPEAPHLLGRASGYLVTPDRSDSGGLSAIRVVAIPEMTEHKITPTVSGGVRFIRALSGPDQEGRIAFIQHNPQESPYPNHVKVIRVDGSGEREIVRVPAMTPGGKHEWLDPGIGKHISISPVRARIAFLRDLGGRQMPGARLSVGSLEVWDAEAIDRLCAQGSAVDRGISWLPDGRRVSYVAFLPRDQVPGPSEGDLFGKEGSQSFAAWKYVPAITILDVETLDTTVVGLGTDPVIAADGKQILARDFAGNLRAIDFVTGEYTSIEPPGLFGPVVACLPGGLVLYQSRPTEGRPVQRSPYGSFRAGIQLLPIKVCDLSTGEFQTILEAVDPRHQVSFGAKH